MATFTGKSAAVVAALVCLWRNSADGASVDRFCAALRENGLSLPIIYFCEWIDRWLMGDLVPGPNALEGPRYQMACFSREQALAWAEQCGHQHLEQQWLSSRLKEAASVCDGVAKRVTVIVVREILGGSTLDNEVAACMRVVPEWLFAFEEVTDVQS